MLETAKGNELKSLVEEIKDILEKEYHTQLNQFGIQEKSIDLIPLKDLIEFELLDSEKEKIEFKVMRENLHDAIRSDVETLKESWVDGFQWYLDKIIYSFFNRIFAIRILEEFGLLEESTLIAQADLGNRSARMAKIQEKHPNAEKKWWMLLLQDVFAELNKQIKVIFDPKDPALAIYPRDEVIALIVTKLNTINNEIYRAEDCIGWFYHYYVVKFRKTHKTMSSHGSKSPANPYFLSILNTVYTPRWMVQILVDNSLGHWWANIRKTSTIFSASPYYITKNSNDLVSKTTKPENLRLLDPACGSGNFLVYTFSKLVEIYREFYPDWSYEKIIKTILEKNLFGIDINRRPAQLSALALYILAKKTLKEKQPKAVKTFVMPSVNIICCDIRLPEGDRKTQLLNTITKEHREVVTEILDLFNNADQLGSLIDVSGLQKRLAKMKKQGLDQIMQTDAEVDVYDIVKIVDSFIENNLQNLGLQMFGEETKQALSLAQVLLQKYDLVMGNPPFGLVIDKTKEKLRKYYPNTYADLVSMFVDQGLRILNPNGYLAMVTDFSFLHLPKFENFRRNILLSKSVIEEILMIGYGSLPNSGNRPLLFILRNNTQTANIKGLYRNPNYDINKSFDDSYYSLEIGNDILSLNQSPSPDLPHGWNRIPQKVFQTLPRAVIDLTIEEKYEPLLEFFEKYPRLDISQHLDSEKKTLKNKEEISRCYNGSQTGNNDAFVINWYEIEPHMIRLMENITSIDQIIDNIMKPFVPFSKGGGDIRYYLNNGYIVRWNKNSIEEMKNFYSVFRNVELLGISDLFWSLSTGKPRGRFVISQEHTLSDVSSMSVKIIDNSINKFLLLAYLNSKFINYIVRLQTKDRKWQAGNVARIPIPNEFLKKKETKLTPLSKESYILRRNWDTGYPMSPIFAESLMDKIINPNQTIVKLGLPKTGHPFCEEYQPCESETAKQIDNIIIAPKKCTIDGLLKGIHQRFSLLTSRLDAIDDEINKILYELIDERTQQALDDYYDRFVGPMTWIPEPDIWLQDFLMANLMTLIQKAPRGIVTFRNFIDGQEGLYNQFITQLCQKFDRKREELSPILTELQEKLGKSLENWILKDFFFYHCQRFGGRPIVWQFTSKFDPRKEATLNIFIDYHQLTENTLPTIRVDMIQPLLKKIEHQRDTHVLGEDESYKIEEINQFLKAFLELEKGYSSIPNPNALTGKNSADGMGDDKTWQWVFQEAAKVIEKGYKPDLFKGVLINLIPLCIDLTEERKERFKIKYRSITPKGTIKKILKKLDALDQLRQTSLKPDTEETSEEEGEGESEENLDSADE